MTDTRLTLATIIAAFMSFAGTCEKPPLAPTVLSPEAGQLLRNAESFVIEIQASTEEFDLETLQANLNGQPLELLLGKDIHTANHGNGATLEESNELIVSAQRLSDEQYVSTTRTFSWRKAPSDDAFHHELVSEPPPVETAEIEILNGDVKRQNALMRVQFRSDWDAPESLPFRVDSQTVIELADHGEGDDEKQGDGVFTARIDFDYDNYLARKAGEILESAFSTEESNELAFQSRQLVEAQPLDVDLRLSGLITSPIIPLVPLPPILPVLDPERALLIRDLSVVADPLRTFDPCDLDGDGVAGNPNGAWSFKTMMVGMANTATTGVPLDVFVKEWLAAWAQNFDVANGGSVTGDWNVNDDVVPHREPGLVSQIIDPWPKTATGDLDLDQAPFRLLAIVNRVDLRDSLGYGVGAGSAGELRFVYGLLDMNSCQATRMTAIFEYTVHKDTCADVVAHAQKWEDLDLMNAAFPATPAYLNDLQNITDPVTMPGAVPGQPNDSSIGQLRTSELVMGSPWEMREFTLQQQPTGLVGQNVLRMDTTKQTPDLDYTVNPAMQPVLTHFINTNLADICDGSHVVPDTWLGLPFMSGRSDFFMNSHFWSPGIAPFLAGGCTDDDIRFNFSSNTCSGCHGADTIDPLVDQPFYHVHPDSPPGLPAELSRFLTGTGASPIPDPSPMGGIPRAFADLDRRVVDLQNLLAVGCPTIIAAPPGLIQAVH